MTIHFHYLTASLGLGIWLGIIWLIRKDRLHVRYAFWWFVVGTAVALVGLYPYAVDWVGRLFGVSYPPILGLVVGFCLIFVKVLINDLERSRQKVQIRILAQKMAVLEQQVERSKLEDRRSEEEEI